MKAVDQQKGFTLVEIMIALIIGAFLIGGVLKIFLNSKQTYRMQENLSRMQENGHFALEFLSRDVRGADFWGCIKSTNIENKLNSDTTFNPFANGISGQNDDNGGNDGDSNNDENGNNIWDGTDSIILRGAGGSPIYISSQPTTTAASIKVANNSGLSANDIVIISNCTAGDIFQITNVTSSGGFDNIIHNTGSVSSGPGNASSRLEIGPEPNPAQPNANRYGTDSKIYKLNFVEYQIRNNTQNRPSLFKSTNGGAFQELIDNIENMQILYGEDTSGDNVANYYVPADQIVNMDNVISIRIDLLVVSPQDNLTSQAVPYTYNGATTTPTDKRLRRVFSTTVAVRNRLL